MIEIILARFKEPSTWRGLTALAALVGITISPELQTAIITAAVGVFAVIEVVRKERSEAKKK